jgi:hypothetical protein
VTADACVTSTIVMQRKYQPRLCNAKVQLASHLQPAIDASHSVNHAHANHVLCASTCMEMCSCVMATHMQRFEPWPLMTASLQPLSCKGSTGPEFAMPNFNLPAISSRLLMPVNHAPANLVLCASTDMRLSSRVMATCSALSDDS